MIHLAQMNPHWLRSTLLWLYPASTWGLTGRPCNYRQLRTLQYSDSTLDYRSWLSDRKGG